MLHALIANFTDAEIYDQRGCELTGISDQRGCELMVVMKAMVATKVAMKTIIVVVMMMSKSI